MPTDSIPTWYRLSESMPQTPGEPAEEAPRWGGDAIVNSEVGVNLPRPGTSQQRTRTILIADDDSAVRSLFANALRRNHFVVHTACDGAQALALARDCASTIDLLLTDFEMPDLNGIQLAAAIRQLFPRISVVLMSGLPNPVTAEGSVRTFLRKPFTPLTLMKTVTALLGEPNRKSPHAGNGSSR
jgi:DNA-binding NtrC family response regulator